jgi:hypothetical protein
MNQYFSINQKSMADALVFLGFNYYKFDDKQYGKIYSFVNSEKLQQSIHELNKLKNKINN